jgi:deoxyadenosine/deoxycytidine kinase
MNGNEVDFLWQVEQFGYEAIRLFFDKGVDLGGRRIIKKAIIMEALNQDAETKMIADIQAHFDEHFEAGETCPDIEQVKKIFDIEEDPVTGRVTVLKYKSIKGEVLH